MRPAPSRAARFGAGLSLALMGALAAAQSPPLPTWTVSAEHGAFTSARITVPAGRRIKLILNNRGRTPLEFENTARHIEKVLAPGSRSFIVLTLPPGEHAFIDEFDFVKGALTVVAE